MRKGILGVIALLAGSCGNAASSGSESGTPTSSGGTQSSGHASGGSRPNAVGGGGTSGGAFAGMTSTGGVPNGGAVTTSGGSAPTSGGSIATGGATGGAAAAPGASGGTVGSGGALVTAGTAGVASGSGGVSAGGAPATGGKANDATTLKDKYAELFPIGAAVDSKSYMTHADLLTRHFNSVTAENEMKFESLQRNEGQFTYGDADRIVDFAARNNMKVRGHALVWHTQTPAWVFSNGSGGNASREQLFTRMRNHISNVMQHFRGKVPVWDVVNEAIMDDGSYRDGNEEGDKKSKWYEIAGKDYIAEAFRAAHEADPDAKLFYNDFYDYIPAKQQAIHDMLKELIDQGVPVHGVGMQCHLNIEPSTNPMNQGYHQHVSNLEQAIELYSSLGIEVQVTELDVSLYVPGVMYTTDTFYTQATFTEALQIQQAERYREFFALFRKYAANITSVTFWGIADDNTWLSEFDSGRDDFPLLFDTAHEPKKAFDAVMDF